MVQADEEGTPATTPRPACASAAQQGAAAAHEHTDPAQTQHQRSEGTAPSVDQGGQLVGSPGVPNSAGEHDSPHCVDPPASLESDPPSTPGAAGAALQTSAEGEDHTAPQSSFPVMLDNAAPAFWHLPLSGQMVSMSTNSRDLCQKHLLHAIVCYCAAGEETEEQREALAEEHVSSHTPPSHSSGGCSMHSAMSSGSRV